MGFGMVLGGIAKGITGQQELAQKSKALDLQTAELQNNNAYRNASLGLEQKRLDATTALEGQGKALQIYNGMENLLKTAVTESLKNGQPAAVVANAAPVKALVGQMQSLAQAAGLDPNAPRNTLGVLLQGGNPNDLRVGQAWEAVQQKIKDGQPLTPGEEELKNLKISEFKAMMGGGGDNSGGDLPTDSMSPTAPTTLPAPAAAAPAAASTMAPAVTAPGASSGAQPHPPVPANLIGKVVAWSAKTQRFYDKAGNAYNQQGVPLQ